MLISSKEKLSLDTYAGTLRLPRTSFPLWSDPKHRDEPYRKRTTEELYRWQWANVKRPLFVLHDGPPCPNGSLHMGHALNKTLKDVINRYRVLQGYRVHYMPGWDCHGLPIEHKALQELKVDHRSTPSSVIREAARLTAAHGIEVQRSEFKAFGIMADWSSETTYRTYDHEYKIRHLKVLLELVRKGLIYRRYRPVWWSPSSRTTLAEGELIRVDDHKSRSVYVKFLIDRADLSQGLRTAISNLQGLESSTPFSLLIWTSAPWTLPANLAVAINGERLYSLVKRVEHPEDGVLILATERVESLEPTLGILETMGSVQGSDLVGTGYSHLFSPSISLKLRVLASCHVSSSIGTGVVHSAPVHSAEDCATFLNQGVVPPRTSLVCPVDDDGRFTEEVLSLARNPDHGRRLVGMEVLYGGTEEIIAILKESSALVAEKEIKHKYLYDWRTKQPIIVRATTQWFVSLDDIKKDALSTLNNVNFHPESSQTRLRAHVAVRSEWGISRQRTWGVPLPALHDLETNEAILTTESLTHIITVLEDRGVEHWLDGPVDDFIAPSLRATGRKLVRGTDTIDVWFDSGTAWSMLRDSFGARGGGDGTGGYFADVCVEGSDQDHGWFQTLLLTSVAATMSSSPSSKPVSPYKNLLTHGHVLDQAGKKMSKSTGNVISPLTVIHGGEDKQKDPTYGADVLRLWAASVEYGRDVPVGPTILAQAAKRLHKIRNVVRFLLANTNDGGEKFELVPRQRMGLLERYVMHRLYLTERSCKAAYDEFNFPKVVSTLTEFMTQTLSSFYFDIIKDCLYASAHSSLERRATVTVLHEVLRTVVPIMAPILPHLAEEVHQVLIDGGSVVAAPGDFSVFVQGWKPVSKDWEDSGAENDMRLLIKGRSAVLKLLEQARKRKNIRSSFEAAVQIELTGGHNTLSLARLLQREEPLLKSLFLVSNVELCRELTEPEKTWHFDGDFNDPSGSAQQIRIRVQPSKGKKCPRCWQWSRAAEDVLCMRCEDVIGPRRTLVAATINGVLESIISLFFSTFWSLFVRSIRVPNVHT